MGKINLKEMSEDEIRGELESMIKTELIVSLPPETKVTMVSKFREDLMLDSLDMAELTYHAECRFGVNIPEGDVANLITVRDYISYLKGQFG
jgi:acyl carrier protein